jgi:DNA-binding NarL/FixJ family response regulator
MTVRAVLADDSYIFREGMSLLLADVADIEVVASCKDADALAGAIDEVRPDVVVTDIRMPPTNTDEGIRIASRLRESHPNIGVVVLSQYSEPDYALRLIASGSAGRAYLLKERVHDREELVRAIHAVARGDSVIDPKVVEELVAANASTSRLADLTRREIQVLTLIAQGRSNAAIAEQLVLGKRAVEKHINAIFLKFDLSSAQNASEISPRVAATLIYLAESASSV